MLSRFSRAAAIIAGVGIFRVAVQPRLYNRLDAQYVAPKTAVHRATSGDALLYAFGPFRNGSGLILDYPSGKIITNFVPSSGYGAACSDKYGNVYIGGRDNSTSNRIISEYRMERRRPLRR